MAIVRSFTKDDTSQIWLLLNELGSAINTFGSLRFGNWAIEPRHESIYPGSTAGASYTQQVAFTTTFSEVPFLIFGGLITTAAGTGKVTVRCFNPTVTGCTAWATTYDGSSLPNQRMPYDLLVVGKVA
jgi:hypothetical protein